MPMTKIMNSSSTTVNPILNFRLMNVALLPVLDLFTIPFKYKLFY